MVNHNWINDILVTIVCPATTKPLAFYFELLWPMGGIRCYSPTNHGVYELNLRQSMSGVVFWKAIPR